MRVKSKKVKRFGLRVVSYGKGGGGGRTNGYGFIVSWPNEGSKFWSFKYIIIKLVILFRKNVFWMSLFEWFDSRFCKHHFFLIVNFLVFFIKFVNFLLFCNSVYLVSYGLLIWFIQLKIFLYFVYGLVHLAPIGFGGADLCAETLEGSSGLSSPPSKVSCERDIASQWSSHSSIEASDLLRITVFIVMSRTAGDSPVEKQAWIIVLFSSEDENKRNRVKHYMFGVRELAIYFICIFSI